MLIESEKMSIISRLIPALAILASTACADGGTCPRLQAAAEGGYRYDDQGITVLDLHGSWYEMGRQYGVLAKSEMNDVLAYIDASLRSEGADPAGAADIAEKLYANYPSHLKEFFAGAGETSEIGPERLKLCNAVEYIEGCFFCSALAVWNEWSKDGSLIFGRNYDATSFSAIARDIVVTVFHPNGCQAAATIGYAGELYCVNGLNESGLFIELNNGMPSAGSDIDWDLYPSTSTLFDALFKVSRLEQFDSLMHSDKSFAGFVIGAADSREARSYEWCTEGCLSGNCDNPAGLMTITNHYVNPGWGFAAPTDSTSWNSLKRRENLNTSARKSKGTIGVRKMQRIMSATLENGGPLCESTRYQIVAVPEKLTLFINIPGRKRAWPGIGFGKYFGTGEPREH